MREKREYLLDSYDIRTAENFFRWDIVYGGTNYKMYQDLPFEIVKHRRAQMETFKKARRNNIAAVFSKAQPDKLYIRGKLWPFGMPLDP